ncbi:hypothetical protein JOD62_001829 [Microbacterium keratanolyticum]|uniref:DUF2975 domain-containing protein n=1 Tax=Microbacterium keratanolyticum TaxID=67574 RepID=A0A9W6HR41_9MICO|nr:hypothetical protein [Microbacterium keratanolyticum]MBM7469281.1 hypothetical protein [Microbacterium keratanolyticum]GLK01361.1 hypothetical protein GCM10017596_10760 [Microbacterium keratanolyticum]
MTSQQTALTRGDRIALFAFVAAGAAIAAGSAITAIARIIEIARGTDVPVLVEFTGQNATIAHSGGNLDLAIEQGVVLADSLDPIAIVPGILGQLTFLLTILTIVATLVLLSRNILRGRVFSRGNTRLVMIAGVGGLAGFSLAKFFDTMLANAAIAEAAPGLDNLVMTIAPFTLILGAFAIAAVGTAFTVGDRLQRDTEGLV